MSVMSRPTVKKRHTELPRFQSVSRITSFPIVESGINIAGTVYDKIKHSNSLINWSLGTAEQSLALATASAIPAIYAFNGPISTIDHLLCKGIDMVEQRVPVVHLHPQIMYSNTREYVNNKIVKPVLLRAGSMTHIGSQAANAAADRLDGALTVADAYIDRYLPPDPNDNLSEDTVDSSTEPTSKAARTIEHGARFSRKLQKRLTRRTLAEAKALKNQGTECIHVLVYVIELVATDPKLAMEKAKELWISLSKAEPENQARPQTLEHLLVLLTRESARRMVHLINGLVAFASKSPERLSTIFVHMFHQFLVAVTTLMKMFPAARYRDLLLQMAPTATYRDRLNYEPKVVKFNATANFLLEQVAVFLAGRPDSRKVPYAQITPNHNNHLTVPVPINGIE